MEGFNPKFEGRTEEERLVKTIEDSSLDSTTQMELLMLYLGEKPACLFGDSKKRGKFKEEIERVVRELGGDICFDFIEETDGDETLYRIFVGKDKTSLDRLKEAFLGGSGEDRGIALGYPESAAKAFQEGKTLEDHSCLFEGLSEEERQAMQTSMKFKLFGFSSDNYREEMEAVKRWQAMVQENSPEIYQRIVSGE